MQVDMKKLEVALKYVERMADGKNPVKNIAAEEDSVLNNPNVIRCMYFIKEVLAAVKDNEGIIAGKAPKAQKIPFPFECLSEFQYVEDTTISHFLAQLKALAQDPNAYLCAGKHIRTSCILKKRRNSLRQIWRKSRKEKYKTEILKHVR